MKYHLIRICLDKLVTWCIAHPQANNGREVSWFCSLGYLCYRHFLLSERINGGGFFCRKAGVTAESLGKTAQWNNGSYIFPPISLLIQSVAKTTANCVMFTPRWWPYIWFILLVGLSLITLIFSDYSSYEICLSYTGSHGTPTVNSMYGQITVREDSGLRLGDICVVHFIDYIFIAQWQK